jgi:hypothetical protein
VEPPGEGRQHAGMPFRKPVPRPILVLRTIQMIQQTPLLAFPAKAGIYLCRGDRLSPVKRDGTRCFIARVYRVYDSEH